MTRPPDNRHDVHEERSSGHAKPRHHPVPHVCEDFCDGRRNREGLSDNTLPMNTERHAIFKEPTMSAVKAIPAGHHTVTPYLAIKNAAKALEFYKKAFGAIESYKLLMPDGRLGHAEIRLGDSVTMLSDEFP